MESNFTTRNQQKNDLFTQNFYLGWYISDNVIHKQGSTFPKEVKIGFNSEKTPHHSTNEGTCFYVARESKLML